MLELSKDIIFVKGAVNGAIYNFNNQQVYSVNSDGCQIINNFPNIPTSQAGIQYIDLLKNEGLLDDPQNVKEYVLENTHFTPKLEMCWLEITQACNMKCLHCYEGNEHCASRNQLNLEDWKRIINELYKLNVSRVVVIGGEPCVCSYLLDILKELSFYNIKTTLFTNATLLSQEQMDYIIANHNINVKVSIYGHCKDVHDKITQVPGSFDKTMGHIKYLTQNGVKVSAAVIAMKENQEYMEDIKSFALQNHMIYSRFDVIRNVYGGTQSEHVPTKASVVERSFMRKPNFRADKSRFLRNLSGNTCWLGKFAITDNGNVLPCVFERNIVYGNIKQQTVSELLNSKKLLTYWGLTFDSIENCNECEFRYLCKDCRPLGLSVNGDLKGKNPRCLYNVKKGIWGNETVTNVDKQKLEIQ